jgi:hypothetical protein
MVVLKRQYKTVVATRFTAEEKVRKPPGLFGIKGEILKILYDVRLTVGYVSRWKLQGSKFHETEEPCLGLPE